MFPMMEKYGMTAPPQVMWGVDDEIKDKIKNQRNSILENYINEIKNY